MSILELRHWSIDPDYFTLTVEAMVDTDEGFIPCVASVALAELEDWPEDDQERLAFLEACKPDWILVEEF